jgi:hypothetical protein
MGGEDQEVNECQNEAGSADGESQGYGHWPTNSPSTPQIMKGFAIKTKALEAI